MKKAQTMKRKLSLSEWAAIVIAGQKANAHLSEFNQFRYDA